MKLLEQAGPFLTRGDHDRILIASTTWQQFNGRARTDAERAGLLAARDQILSEIAREAIHRGLTARKADDMSTTRPTPNTSREDERAAADANRTRISEAWQTLDEDPVAVEAFDAAEAEVDADRVEYADASPRDQELASRSAMAARYTAAWQALPDGASRE